MVEPGNHASELHAWLPCRSLKSLTTSAKHWRTGPRRAAKSLQSFLLRLITEEAHRSTNFALLERFAGRHDGSLLSAVKVTEELDQARAGRDEVLIGVTSDAL
ncbi:MAG: hypothetical protein ABJD68_07225 [Nakamurella sp.]